MIRFASAFALTTLLACGGGDRSTAGSGGSTPPTGQWVLAWSDEFSGANGTAPNAANWTFDLGAGGWGNNELQTYTDSLDNAQIQDGNLVITALKTASGYTSARLKTQGRFAQPYGRFEARIKVPTAAGIWPAFWMLGQDLGTLGWPACGEIDIMEVVGKTPSTVYGTIHGPGYSGSGGLGGSTTLASGRLSDDYHLYAVEWEGTTIRWYLDGQLYATRILQDLPGGAPWVFDHPFFLILNLAVGGNWPGSPDASTPWPQKLYVDYIRVYKRS